MRLHVYVLEVLREFFLRLCSFATEGGSCTDRFCSGQSRPPHSPGTVWSIIFMNIYFFVQINYSSCTSVRLTVHCLEHWYIFRISGHNCLRNRTLLNWKLNFPFFFFFVLGSLFADPIEKLSRPEWRHLWGHVTHLTSGESYEEVQN